MKPITPAEAKAKKEYEIPPEVFEAFNELIVKNLNGRYSCFSQKLVYNLVVKKFAAKDVDVKARIYGEHWLDVEPFYRKAGWEVEYDKPGYNESYEANFTFSIPR